MEPQCTYWTIVVDDSPVAVITMLAFYIGGCKKIGRLGGGSRCYGWSAYACRTARTNVLVGLATIQTTRPKGNRLYLR
jgi:hypothetical protein